MVKATTTLSTEDKLNHILTVLKHTELPQPDYHAVAKELGISTANTAQKKFKAYVEQAGFKLVDRQIVDADGDKGGKGKGAGKRTKPSSPIPKNNRGTVTSGNTKKRKVEEVLISDDEEEEAEDIVAEVKTEAGDGSERTDTDEETNFDEDGDRFRRSRARSVTMKAE